MNHIFVTGANRGIGLEIVRQLGERPKTTVYAACRRPDSAAELQAVASRAHGTVHVIPLEVTDPAQIAALVAFLDSLTDPAAINGRLGVPETVPSGLPVPR